MERMRQKYLNVINPLNLFFTLFSSQFFMVDRL